MKKIIFACVVFLLSLCLLVPCFAEEASTPSGETVIEGETENGVEGTPASEEKPESEADGTLVPEEEPESEWNLGNFGIYQMRESYIFRKAYGILHQKYFALHWRNRV